MSFLIRISGNAVLLPAQSSSRWGVLLNWFPLQEVYHQLGMCTSTATDMSKASSSMQASQNCTKKIKRPGMQQTWNIGTYSITKQVLAHRKAVLCTATCTSWSLCTFLEVAKTAQHPNKNNVSYIWEITAHKWTTQTKASKFQKMCLYFYWQIQ